MILVSEAGWRSASALVPCSTCPEFASTTMSAYGGVYATTRAWWWRLPRRERASAGSVVTAASPMTVARVQSPKRRPSAGRIPRSIRLSPSHTQEACASDVSLFARFPQSASRSGAGSEGAPRAMQSQAKRAPPHGCGMDVNRRGNVVAKRLSGCCPPWARAGGVSGQIIAVQNFPCVMLQCGIYCCLSRWEQFHR